MITWSSDQVVFGQRKHVVERPCARVSWRHEPTIPTNTDKNAR
jgi:hypothetical protein